MKNQTLPQPSGSGDLKKKTKFVNKKIEIDGHKFSSKKEAAYYQELKLLETQGLIHGLTPHPKFIFPINGVPVRYLDSNRTLTYTPDFEYFTSAGERKVIDVKAQVFKGKLTARQKKTKAALIRPEYKIKRALMLAVHGIFVEEV